MTAIVTAAAFSSFAMLASGAAAGDRGDSGLDADDARTDMLLGAFEPPHSLDHGGYARSRPADGRRAHRQSASRPRRSDYAR